MNKFSLSAALSLNQSHQHRIHSTTNAFNMAAVLVGATAVVFLWLTMPTAMAFTSPYSYYTGGAHQTHQHSVDPYADAYRNWYGNIPSSSSYSSRAGHAATQPSINNHHNKYGAYQYESPFGRSSSPSLSSHSPYTSSPYTRPAAAPAVNAQNPSSSPSSGRPSSDASSRSMDLNQPQHQQHRQQQPYTIMKNGRSVTQVEDDEACKIMVTSNPTPLHYGISPRYRVEIVDKKQQQQPYQPYYYHHQRQRQPSNNNYMDNNNHHNGYTLRINEQSSYNWMLPRWQLFNTEYDIPADHVCAARIRDASYHVDAHTGLLTISLPKLQLPSSQPQHHPHQSQSHPSPTTLSSVPNPKMSTTSSTTSDTAASSNDLLFSSFGVTDDGIEISEERHIEEAPEKGLDAVRGYTDLHGNFQLY